MITALTVDNVRTIGVKSSQEETWISSLCLLYPRSFDISNPVIFLSFLHRDLYHYPPLKLNPTPAFADCSDREPRGGFQLRAARITAPKSKLGIHYLGGLRPVFSCACVCACVRSSKVDEDVGNFMVRGWGGTKEKRCAEESHIRFTATA